MNFKKKKIQKSNIFLNIFGSIIIILVLVLGVYSYNKITGFRDKETITDENGKEITVKREPIKETTVLIVGRGGDRNDAPELTDTIILAKINGEKKTVSLLSIQRDLYVNYPDKDGHGKLNSVYASYFYKNGRNVSEAMGKLAEKITDITGEKIDHYVNIDFNGFEQLIDKLGGIEIDVPNRLVDTTFPNETRGYKTVVFEKGLQTMNGKQALMYARSRHSTSDYDRSLRQQQVIKAVKDKVSSSYLVTNPSTITDLYNVFKQYLKTDVELTDAINLILDLNIFKENYSFVSSNFNDTCFSNTSECEKGGILYVPNREYFGGLWVSLIRGSTYSKLSEYELSRKYAQIVLNFPMISEENAEINIFNGTNISGAGALVNQMKKYGFKFSQKNYVLNTPGKEPYEKTIIYYNGISENSDTIQALKEFFAGEIVRIPEPKYSQEKAKIEIILGKDYFTQDNIFTF